MPWDDLVDWYRKMGHFESGRSATAGTENGSPNSKSSATNGWRTTDDERQFLIHALWDVSSFTYPTDFRDFWTEPPQLDAPAYVVAYIDGDDSTLRHELAHALFYLEATYRTLARSIWDSLGKDHRTSVENALCALGYDETNYADEFQAYTLEDYRVWSGVFNVKSGKPVNNTGTDPLAAASKKLLADFESFGLERELTEAQNDRRYRAVQQ